MSVSRLVARVVGIGAVSLTTLAMPADVREMRLLQLFVVGRGETIDVVRNSKMGRSEIVATYRELKPEEPEAAAGVPYRVHFAWNDKAAALVPVRVDGETASARNGVFGKAGCVHPERTITRMDFELWRNGKPQKISVDAPILNDLSEGIAEQRIRLQGAGTSGSFLLIDEISNLCFLDAAVVPFVPNRAPYATIAMEFYRGRAIAIVGTDTDWKMLPEPDFITRAGAEAYMRKVKASFGLDK